MLSCQSDVVRVPMWPIVRGSSFQSSQIQSYRDASVVSFFLLSFFSVILTCSSKFYIYPISIDWFTIFRRFKPQSKTDLIFKFFSCRCPDAGFLRSFQCTSVAVG